ncbi:uncharacterized protein L201_003860 [Kwoniella dendrophila CBS 6074]|uniref:Barwin domain-containing protein n=1 Tax=Kwoniella dendrophila CBS 6074 TaxID=1295534 RepID=A0AAX4JU45_9TREE
MLNIFYFTVTALLGWRIVKAGQRFDNAQMTIYYDLNWDCNNDQADAKGASKLNGNTTACGYSAQAIGSSRHVAVNQGLFSFDKCGTEISILRNGQPVTFSEGPLFIGDICPECAPDHIDIGAKVAVELANGAGCKNPTGLGYQIGDRIVGPAYSSTDGGSLDSWKASQSTQGSNQASSSSSSPSSSSANAAPSSTQSSWQSTKNNPTSSSSWTPAAHWSSAVGTSSAGMNYGTSSNTDPSVFSFGTGIPTTTIPTSSARLSNKQNTHNALFASNSTGTSTGPENITTSIGNVCRKRTRRRRRRNF